LVLVIVPVESLADVAGQPDLLMAVMMRTVSDLHGGLEETRRRILDLAAEMRQQSVDWRQRVHARVESFGVDEAHDQDEGVPEDAPRQYGAVRDRVARGELDWFDVLAGRVDDVDARAVHAWADGRMETGRQVLRLLERGVSLDDAVDSVGVSQPSQETRR
jgi:hypothetical protein